MTTSNPPIFDGHNDTLLNLHMPQRGQGRTFFERSDQGHIDLPRAKEGGLGGGFFATFVPNRRPMAAFPGSQPGAAGYAMPLPPALDHVYALEFVMGMVARLIHIEKESAGQTKIVRTADELAYSLDNDIFAMIMHFEGAEAIDTDLNSLELFYAAGLRSIGLVWSRPNNFGHGVPFSFPATPDTGPGLTDAGKALVKACNQLGVMVDLSHLNEAGFWDVAAITDAPLVATHSGAHAMSATPRNLTDKQMDAIRESGGVAGVNYHVGFLRADGDSKAETSVTEIVRHVDYMVERMGIDHVALGSDFDGATMPTDLKDAAGLPKLMDALRAAGYDQTALEKIAYKNWVQVLRKSWK